MLSPGTQAVALYTYNAGQQFALPILKNEALTVVATIPDPNWVKVRNSNGREGIVPISYLDLKRPPPVRVNGDCGWFHGEITREQTERLLAREADGKFLVRSSLKFRGDYTLSVKYNGGVEHYHIFQKERGYSIDDEEFFQTLDDLINHYTEMADGLCTNLKGFVTNLEQIQVKQLEQGGWNIDFNRLTIEEKIGQGEFGDVMLGKYEGREVAVKCFKNTNNTVKSLFALEASLMTRLMHPNLVSFVGVSYEKNQVYLITEYMQNGSLVSYLRTRGRAMISKQDQLGFSIDASKGMVYLESENLIHRDLAARNILLSHNLVAKVADFGLAREADTNPSNKNNQPGKIPVKWTAPEAVKSNQFSSKSDVWSYGILLWEIYSYGRMPYPKLLAGHVIEYLEKGNRMDPPEDCPHQIYNLMKSSWNMDPSKRPTFKQILRDLEQLKLET